VDGLVRQRLPTKQRREVRLRNALVPRLRHPAQVERSILGPYSAEHGATQRLKQVVQSPGGDVHVDLQLLGLTVADRLAEWQCMTRWMLCKWALCDCGQFPTIGRGTLPRGNVTQLPT
jgi:hypothetical protein